MADGIVSYEKLKKWKYKIEASIIDAGEEINLEDRNIKEFFVENNFTENFFPILRIQFMLSSSVYYRVQKYRNKAKVRVRLLKFNVDDPDDYHKNAYKAHSFSYSRVFEGVFQPFIVDMNPQKRQDLDEQGDNADRMKDLKTQPDIDNLLMEMYLFNLKHLNVNKNIINAVISNNTIKNTIGFVFNEVGIDAVLMNMPENDRVYDQILIPPFNFKSTISYLSNTFGIFKNGVRQFLDFDMYYLLTNDLKEIPVRVGEYETVFVNVGKLSDPMSSQKEGSYKDNKNKSYVINLPMNASFSTQGTFVKELKGNKLKVYELTKMRDGTVYDDKSGTFSFGTGYTEKKADVDGYEDGNDKISFAYNHLENGFLDAEAIRQNEENNLVIVMELNDVDMEMLTLNKRFVLRFQDVNTASTYNGIYKLNKIVYGFHRDNNEVAMSMYAQVEFKLVRKA
jgi:hypothetical protein